MVFGQFPSVKIVKLFKNGQMVHGLSLNLKVHDNVKFASASSVLEEFHNSEVLEAEVRTSMFNFSAHRFSWLMTDSVIVF